MNSTKLGSSGAKLTLKVSGEDNANILQDALGVTQLRPTYKSPDGTARVEKADISAEQLRSVLGLQHQDLFTDGSPAAFAIDHGRNVGLAQFEGDLTAMNELAQRATDAYAKAGGTPETLTVQVGALWR